jgi:hypothetical protein
MADSFRLSSLQTKFSLEDFLNKAGIEKENVENPRAIDTTLLQPSNRSLLHGVLILISYFFNQHNCYFRAAPQIFSKMLE